jgi:hypothetical protein
MLPCIRYGIMLKRDDVIFNIQSTTPDIIVWIGKSDTVVTIFPDWRLGNALPLIRGMVNLHPLNTPPGKSFRALV